jgi:hypothetical protein
MPKRHNIQKATLNGKIHNSGFRVLTMDLKSLGLRNNPNIIQYSIGQWFYLPKEKTCRGNSDWGGIWVARTPGNAYKLARYMREMHDVETRIFRAALDKILYSNSYRIKTNGIFLLEELQNHI